MLPPTPQEKDKKKTSLTHKLAQGCESSGEGPTRTLRQQLNYATSRLPPSLLTSLLRPTSLEPSVRHSVFIVKSLTLQRRLCDRFHLYSSDKL